MQDVRETVKDRLDFVLDIVTEVLGERHDHIGSQEEGLRQLPDVRMILTVHLGDLDIGAIWT